MMKTQDFPSKPRCGAVWMVTTLAVALLVCWAGPDIAALCAPAPFEELLVGGCAAALVCCAAWWWLATTVVVLEVFRGAGASPTRGVPLAVRRVVLAACGVALVGAAQPALATVDAPDRHRQAPESVLEGLPLPQRPVGRLLATQVVLQALPLVVVAPGDSLWSIARTALGPGSTDAEVASYWLRVYRLNHGVIGADPDLIHPGQQLRMPSSRGS